MCVCGHYDNDLWCLQVRQGDRRWYQLKDRKLMARAKGAIQLEMDIVFNHVRISRIRWIVHLSAIFGCNF